MKRLLALLSVIAFASSTGGCVTVKKVVRERVDQDVSGNRGYLAGESDMDARDKPADREYIDIRVEFPTWQEVTAPAAKYAGEQDMKINQQDPGKKEVAVPNASRRDTQLSGNRGYISTKNTPNPAVYEYDEYEIDVYTEPVVASDEIKPAQLADYQEYTVKQGDTLSHIAKAFYGKAAKWTLIYEANADKVKNPAKIKQGTRLKIPSLEAVETGYVK
ncbi:MAG: LysM peptidoglycan-binding domain-containing protein [Candidatus Omnitrophota bacterium]